MADRHPLYDQTLFRDIPGGELDALVDLARPVHLRGSQVLFRKGDPPGNVDFVVSGLAQVVLEDTACGGVVAQIGPHPSDRRPAG